MADGHRRFLFEHTPVRGGWVRLDAAYREALARHHYPAVLRRLLGELLAATALLANNLKFEGSLVVQLQSSGPVKLLVVECTDQLGLRAIAKWEGELPPAADLMELYLDSALNTFCVYEDRVTPAERADYVIRAARVGRDYRSVHPWTNSSPIVAESVQKVFRLAN